jgi:hypothetical protein
VFDLNLAAAPPRGKAWSTGAPDTVACHGKRRSLLQRIDVGLSVISPATGLQVRASTQAWHKNSCATVRVAGQLIRGGTGRLCNNLVDTTSV